TTIKYTSEGEQAWLVRYNGRGHADEVVQGVALDPAGHVYVTGSSRGGPVGLYEYATIKYDKSQGRELWVARYHGQEDQDEGAELAADAEGNVYVTGMGDQRCRMGEKYVRCFAGNYVTVKYGNEGTEQWVARYSPWEGTHRATAIVVDSG